MSQNLSGSGGSQLDYGQQVEDQSFHIYGMYFCGVCKNVMIPIKDMGEKLEFRCKVCDKKTVDFKDADADACVIYNKELKPGSKSAKVDKEFVFDPTIPKIHVECPECGHEVGYYIVTPDEFQTAIDVKIICGNALIGRCACTWTLPLDARLEGLKVKMMNQ